VTAGELTDAELSRWIAERLEPSCQAPSSAVTSRPAYWLVEMNPSRMTSAALNSGAQYEWQPRDLVHDPAMTVMLLEKMKSTEKIVICGDGHWYITRYEHEDFYSANSECLGRAVAEAFALANGWKP